MNMFGGATASCGCCKSTPHLSLINARKSSSVVMPWAYHSIDANSSSSLKRGANVQITAGALNSLGRQITACVFNSAARKSPRALSIPLAYNSTDLPTIRQRVTRRCLGSDIKCLAPGPHASRKMSQGHLSSSSRPQRHASRALNPRLDPSRRRGQDCLCAAQPPRQQAPTLPVCNFIPARHARSCACSTLDCHKMSGLGYS